MRKHVTACLAWLFAFSAMAQSTQNFFRPVAESDVALRGDTRRVLIPKKYNTFQLDFEAFRTALKSAPMEFSPAARSSQVRVSLPTATGAMEDFAICEIQIMHPDLQKKFPEIRTYAGQSLSDPGKTVRMTTSMRGLQAAIYQPDFGVNYIETYAWGQTEFYIAFDRADYPEDSKVPVPPAFESTGTEVFDDEDRFVPTDEAVADRGTLIEPVQLRVFRYAAATTGEFAQDVGANVAEVLAKVVELSNLVSAIFERDIQLRLQLHPQNELLIFMNPSQDPYFGIEVGEFMSQNPAVINQRLGLNGYDVAHVYCRYQGGNAAGVAGGITCTEGKARGCSSGNLPYGDWFLNVVGQEVGHQMTGGHTWNRCNGGGGRNGDVAFEPGSGSTIMSYGGSCGPDNVTGGSDLYYHSGSIEEIRNFYESSAGDCHTIVQTGNNAPEVTLPYQNGFFIPIKTPFELDGSATDPDGDDLTYCWEEMDLGNEVPLQTPEGSSPIFRTRPAVTATNRYFPRLQTVLTNAFDVTEQLPTYTRDLTFRLTARDNRINGGGVSWKDVEFKATGLAGPFLVKTPNTAAEVWHVGELALVSWDVANTDNAPVNCKKVNIRLSTDGGLTYPIMLAEGVDNDGSQYLLVPDQVTTKARVRIDGADNVFFDISNANFKIQQPTAPGLTLGLTDDGGQICLPAKFSTELISASVLGFNEPVSIAFSNLPPGATGALSSTTLTPGQSVTMDIDLSNVTEEGTYVVELYGFAPGIDTVRRPVTLTTVRNDFSAQALLSPADGSTGLGQTQILRWQKSPDANSYDFQLATTPDFAPGSILYEKNNLTVDTFKVPAQLDKAKAYFWRIRPNNECSPHAWVDPFFFSTRVDNCNISEAQDLPKTVTSVNPQVESKINIVTPGNVSKLNVEQVKGFHQKFKDLEVHLISPAGTDVLLFKNKCGSIESTFNMGFDDDSPNAFQCPPSAIGSSVRPQNLLSAFAGQNVTGTWTLRVKDNESGGNGTIEGFKLEFCSSASLNPPYIVNNNVMTIDPGVNRVVSPDLLLIEDANNTHPQLVFTLLSVPKNGHLAFNGQLLEIGDQFTQADLDAENIRYYDYGLNKGGDAFRFMVYDGEGGWLSSTLFNIQLNPLDAQEAPGELGFLLFPNPANDRVTVAFGKSLDSDTRITVFNAAGQLVQTAFVGAGSEQAQLALGNQPEGIYVVMVENAAGTGVKKLILK